MLNSQLVSCPNPEESLSAKLGKPLSNGLIERILAEDAPSLVRVMHSLHLKEC
jgi:hypothetical protein